MLSYQNDYRSKRVTAICEGRAFLGRQNCIHKLSCSQRAISNSPSHIQSFPYLSALVPHHSFPLESLFHLLLALQILWHCSEFSVPWTVQIPKTCLSQEEECHQARTTFRPRLFFIWIWKSTSCLEHSGYCQLHNSEYPIGSGDICNTTTVFIYHKLTQESVILFICAHSIYYAQLWMAATNRQQAFVSWEVTLITLKISGCIHIEGNLPSNKHIHLLLFLLSRHSTRTYSSEQGLDGLRLPWEPFPDSNWLDC